MERSELINSCRGLQTISNNITYTQHQMDKICSSFYSYKKEKQPDITFKKPKEYLMFILWELYIISAIEGLFANYWFITLLVAVFAGFTAYYKFTKKNPSDRVKKIIMVIRILLILFAIHTMWYAFNSAPIIGIILLIMGLIVMAGYIAVTIALVKAKNKKIQEANNILKQKNAELSAEFDKWNNQNIAYRDQLAKAAGNWFPRDYLTPDALNFFVKALENQRADNFRELVNLYETDAHNRRMENKLDRANLLSEQQIQQNYETQRIIREEAAATRESIDRNTKAVNMNTVAVNMNTVSNYAVARSNNNVANATNRVADSIDRLPRR